MYNMSPAQGRRGDAKKNKMAKINFGGVVEDVATREEFPLSKAREVLKDETIAVLGYGCPAKLFSLLKRLPRKAQSSACF